MRWIIGLEYVKKSKNVFHCVNYFVTLCANLTGAHES